MAKLSDVKIVEKYTLPPIAKLEALVNLRINIKSLEWKTGKSGNTFCVAHFTREHSEEPEQFATGRVGLMNILASAEQEGLLPLNVEIGIDEDLKPCFAE